MLLSRHRSIAWMRNIDGWQGKGLNARVEGDPMRIGRRTVFALVHLGIAGVVGSAGAQQTITGIALKSGESIEVSDLYLVANCKSVLRSTPQAEVLDGPPSVSVSVKEAMVTPRAQRCANQVSGGKLVITAGQIEDYSYTPLTLRITYRMRDGERKLSMVYNLSLFP
jgi:hypothetical protein